jgi:hypothetical protein
MSYGRPPQGREARGQRSKVGPPEPEKTRRFLDVYAAIEAKLRHLVGANRFLPFGELVARAAQENRAVRAFATDLKEYGDLPECPGS